MILADEGLNANFIRELRAVGYNVEWIGNIQKGMDDYHVLKLAKEKTKILITEVAFS